MPRARFWQPGDGNPSPRAVTSYHHLVARFSHFPSYSSRSISNKIAAVILILAYSSAAAVFQRLFSFTERKPKHHQHKRNKTCFSPSLNRFFRTLHHRLPTVALFLLWLFLWIKLKCLNRRSCCVTTLRGVTPPVLSDSNATRGVSPSPARFEPETCCLAGGAHAFWVRAGQFFVVFAGIPVTSLKLGLALW